MSRPTRRDFLSNAIFQGAFAASLFPWTSVTDSLFAASENDDLSRLNTSVQKGLDWLVHRQGTNGGWELPEGYPTALTALAGIAILCQGSTPSQGPYADSLRATARYLMDRVQSNGLIGVPSQDDRYTYGHGFALLFLSQIYGEEETPEERKRLADILKRGVQFCGNSQTRFGGWGYVSSLEGGNFDEGSTTVTQVQALRGCRLAGIEVPLEIIDRAVIYIHRCSIREGAGGVQYNIYGGADRSPISAAALASLYSAGHYDDRYAPNLLNYCRKKLGNPDDETNTVGYWHYAHYYFAQVMYRQGGKEWENYRRRLFSKLLNDISPGGYWSRGYLGEHLTTTMNLTILQLDRAALPIYQR